MKLKIPRMAEQAEEGLEALAACGQILQPRPRTHEQAEQHEQDWIYYRLKQGADSVYTRVGMDDYKDHVHLHINLSLKSYFDDEQPPRPSKNAPDLDQVLAPFVGEEVTVLVAGSFLFSLADHPAIVPSTSGRVIMNEDGVEIKMTAGTISLRGFPIDMIMWFANDERNWMRVEARGRTKIKFSENYLLDCAQFIKENAEVFFRRG